MDDATKQRRRASALQAAALLALDAGLAALRLALLLLPVELLLGRQALDRDAAPEGESGDLDAGSAALPGPGRAVVEPAHDADAVDHDLGILGHGDVDAAHDREHPQLD